METIIVEILLPAVNTAHDFVLPAHIPVGAFLMALVEAVRASAEAPVDSDTPCLCERSTSRILPLDKTLSELGIRDGSTLMLL